MKWVLVRNLSVGKGRPALWLITSPPSVNGLSRNYWNLVIKTHGPLRPVTEIDLSFNLEKWERVVLTGLIRITIGTSCGLL